MRPPRSTWLAVVTLALVVDTLTCRAEPAKKTFKSKNWTVELEIENNSKVGYAQAVALDERTKRMLLWGGVGVPSGSGQDLLSLSFASRKLTRVDAEGMGPDGVALPAMAFDPHGQAAYVFGGWALDADKPSKSLFKLDLNGKSPRWGEVESSQVWPPARNGACMVADPQGNGLILFAGDGGPGSVAGFTPLDDLWRFDVDKRQWKVIKPKGSNPPARWHAHLAIDAQRRKAFLFGGAGLGKHEFDRRLFELDLEREEWTIVRTVGSIPPSVQGSTLTYDSDQGALVLFGGLRHEPPGPATLADFWIFDCKGRTWECVEGDDSVRRRDHVGGFDPTTHRHYMLGGRISDEVGNFYKKGQSATSIFAFQLRRN